MHYYPDGTRYLVAASNWGRDSHPDWLLKLERQPRGGIQVNGRRLPVEARQAEGDEYSRLWNLVAERNPQCRQYQKQTAEVYAGHYTMRGNALVAGRRRRFARPSV